MATIQFLGGAGPSPGSKFLVKAGGSWWTRGFDQVLGVAAILAGIGVVAGLMLPRRLTPSSPLGAGRP